VSEAARWSRKRIFTVEWPTLATLVGKPPLRVRVVARLKGREVRIEAVRMVAEDGRHGQILAFNAYAGSERTALCEAVLKAAEERRR
jgi:hypothetical protein